MSARGPWMCLTALLAGALVPYLATAHSLDVGEGPPLPAPFVAVSDRSALWNAVDTWGSSVAWASPVRDGVFEILVADLVSGEERVVTSISGSQAGASLQINSLAFDGRWVVWNDNRFGNFDTFAFDTVTLTSKRLSDHYLPDTSVDVDAGWAVWTRWGQIILYELATDRLTPFDSGEVRASPSIHDGVVAWTKLTDKGRYVVVRPIDAGQAITVAEGAYADRYDPRLAEGRVVWVAYLWTDPTDLGKGKNATRIQMADVSSVASGGVVGNALKVQNLTAPDVPSGAATIGTGRVAWVEVLTPDAKEVQLRVTELETGQSFTVPGPVGAARFSTHGLVVIRTIEGAAHLYVLPWDAVDEWIQVPASRDSVALPAAAIVASCAVLGLILGRGSRRGGRRRS